MSAAERTSIHRDHGLSLPSGRNHPDFPTSDDIDFVDEIHRQIWDAVVSMVNATGEGMSFGVARVEDAIRRMLTVEVFRSQSLWGEHVRLLSALSTGLRTGRIQLRSVDDLYALREVLRIKLPPQVLEFYVATGELFDVADLYRGDDGKFPFARDGFDAMLFADVRCRMYVMYCFEVAKIQEFLDSDEDLTAYLNLPFQLRLSLSGYADHPDQRGFDVDHQGTAVDELLSELHGRDHEDSGSMVA